MLGAVLTKGCNVGGCDILVKVFIDVIADLCHKIKHVYGIVLGFLEKCMADHLGIEMHDTGECLDGPTVIPFPIGRDDLIDRVAKRGSGGMICGNVILKSDIF